MFTYWRGALPEEYQLSFEPSLFSLPQHLQLQAAGEWQSFYMLDKESNQVAAAISFWVESETAYSPIRASFGGMESSLTGNELVGFLEFACQELRQLGMKKMIVRQSPLEAKEELFAKAGFVIQKEETDSFIEVKDDYENKLQPRKAKKLRSLKKSTLTAESIPISRLEEIYSFILQARSQKGYHLSMTLGQVEELARSFPDRVLLFEVKESERIIAASICLRIKSNWLYDFYHDHDDSYDADSPVILLVDAIYGFCQANAIQWIELGTSMHGEKVNENLLLFKERLGGIPLGRVTYEKALA